MNKPTMFDTFEIRGIWWLPKKKKEKLHGTLSYAPESIYLELDGIWPRQRKVQFIEADIILGQSVKGDAITLYKTFEKKVTVLTSSRFVVNYIFFGAHFSSEPQIQFSSIHINCTYLESWIGKSPFKNIAFNNTKPPIKMQFKIPALHSSLKLYSRKGWNHLSVFKTLVQEHTACLEIKPEEKQCFQWWQNILFHLRCLLTLFIGAPIYPSRLEGDIGIKKLFGGKRPLTRDYADIYSRPLIAKMPDDIHPLEMLFPLTEISGIKSKIFKKWFQTVPQLDVVLELFMSTISAEHSYHHLHFLSLMQALECFHRQFWTGKYTSDKKYEAIRNALAGAIPLNTGNSHKDSLKSRIKYGNEYSLRKRVMEICKTLSDGTKKTLFEKPDFVGKLIDTRNYYTHYDEESREEIFAPLELPVVNRRLQTLIFVLLLKKTGVPEGDVVNALKKALYYRSLFPTKILS